MATPTYTTLPPRPGPSMAKKTAAAVLAISDTPLRKGLLSGIIPDLDISTIGILAKRPVITGAIAANGESIPVRRLGAPEPVNDPGDPRKWIGYLQSGSDYDVLSAADRWHKPQGKDLVLTADCFLVVNGSFVGAFVDIVRNTKYPDGITDYDQATDRYWFSARLVARLVDPLSRKVKVLDPTSPHASLATELIGLRVLGGEGGPVTSI